MATKNYNARDLQLVKTVDTLIDVCTTYNSALLQIPKFNEKFEELKAKRTNVSTLSLQKHQVGAGTVSIIGDAAAEKLAIGTYVSNSLGLFTEYCQDEKESTLQTMLPNLVISKITKQKPLNMVVTLQSFVVTAMKINFDKASAYGITQEWVTTLSSRVDEYNAMLPKHNSTKQSKPQTTTDLKARIKEMMLIKKSMDNLIGGFREKHPEFYNAYNASKNVGTIATKKATKDPKTPPTPVVVQPKEETAEAK